MAMGRVSADSRWTATAGLAYSTGMKILLTALALLAAAGSAHAAGIGIRAGTLGVGGDVAWSIAPTLSARLGYSRLDWDADVTPNGVRYDGTLKLSNLNALVDFHPLGPLFRVSGGLVFNDNRYALRAQPENGTFRLGGNVYNAADVGNFDGTVRSGRRAAPYLGIGYGTVAGAGVNFYFDAGILFMGSPRARLNATCGPALGAGACAQLQSDVAAEQARLEDELRRFKHYPVLNVGLTIGF